MEWITELNSENGIYISIKGMCINIICIIIELI